MDHLLEDKMRDPEKQPTASKMLLDLTMCSAISFPAWSHNY